VSECSPSIIIAGVAGVVSHYVPTLTWLVRAAADVYCTQAAVCACRRERRELKHNHYGNALRNENSRALHFILYPRPAHSMHTCRICALIYTQANKSRMNFFLITRDIKERARLERSLNYYRSTAAFASRCAAGNPLQQSTFQDSRITLSACTVHTLTAAETSRCFKSKELKRRTKVGGSFCYCLFDERIYTYTYRISIYIPVCLS
jgi:hypothetical protein